MVAISTVATSDNTSCIYSASIVLPMDFCGVCMCFIFWKFMSISTRNDPEHTENIQHLEIAHLITMPTVTPNGC